MPPKKDEVVRRLQPERKARARAAVAIHDDDSQEKKSKVHSPAVVLTPEQEKEVAQWWQYHDFLYRKGSKDFKDTAKRKATIQEKAAQLDLTCKYTHQKPSSEVGPWVRSIPNFDDQFAHPCCVCSHDSSIYFLGFVDEQFTQWMHSIRGRIGREDSPQTDRHKDIMEKFGFLQVHIARKTKSPGTVRDNVKFQVK
jgi:hypothetical protein